MQAAESLDLNFERVTVEGWHWTPQFELLPQVERRQMLAYLVERDPSPQTASISRPRGLQISKLYGSPTQMDHLAGLQADSLGLRGAGFPRIGLQEQTKTHMKEAQGHTADHVQVHARQTGHASGVAKPGEALSGDAKPAIPASLKPNMEFNFFWVAALSLACSASLGECQNT
jgi:hypothetical protein